MCTENINHFFFFQSSFLQMICYVPSFNPLLKTSTKAFFSKVLQRTLHCWNNFRICVKFSVTKLLFQNRKQLRNCMAWGLDYRECCMILMLFSPRYCWAEVVICARALSCCNANSLPVHDAFSICFDLKFFKLKHNSHHS